MYNEADPGRKRQSSMDKNERRAYCLSVAQTIFKQLFWNVTPSVVLSWGISERTSCWYKEMASLRMKVNGMVHKGYVMVSYDEGLDLYQLFLMDTNHEVVKEMADICADELGQRIDEEIEKPLTVSDTEYRAGIFREAVAV